MVNLGGIHGFVEATMEIRCTNCGADLPLEMDSDFISCAFCEAALFVDEDSTVTSYYLRPELREDDLQAALDRQLAAMDIPPARQLRQKELVFYPFWRFETGGTKVLLISAADAPAFEMTELYMPGGRPVSFHPSAVEQGRVIVPDTLYQEAKQAFENAWASGPPKERLPELKALSISLVHLALYHVTYEVAGHRYRAWVDAVWGKVFADEWPPNADRKKNLVLGSLGLGVLSAFFLESLLMPFSLALLIGYAATAVFAYYLSLFALARLDSGGMG
jgi:hypothetical protein